MALTRLAISVARAVAEALVDVGSGARFMFAVASSLPGAELKRFVCMIVGAIITDDMLLLLFVDDETNNDDDDDDESKIEEVARETTSRCC